MDQQPICFFVIFNPNLHDLIKDPSQFIAQQSFINFPHTVPLTAVHFESQSFPFQVPVIPVTESVIPLTLSHVPRILLCY